MISTLKIINSESVISTRLSWQPRNKEIISHGIRFRIISAYIILTSVIKQSIGSLMVAYNIITGLMRRLQTVALQLILMAWEIQMFTAIISNLLITTCIIKKSIRFTPSNGKCYGAVLCYKGYLILLGANLQYLQLLNIHGSNCAPGTQKLRFLARNEKGNAAESGSKPTTIKIEKSWDVEQRAQPE